MKENIKNEYDVFDLIKRVWDLKYRIMIFVFLVSLGTAIYSLIVSEQYTITCTIDPAAASDETLVGSESAFAGFSLMGSGYPPVVKSLALTLESSSFIKIFYEKYKDDKRLFKKTFDGIYKNKKLTAKEIEEAKLEVALKALSKIIKFSVNVDNNIINLSVILPDKYFAYELMNDILSTLKTYVKDRNMKSLKADIDYYNEIKANISDPAIKKKIEYIITDKIKKRYIISSNLFTIIKEPIIPFKRTSPKRTSMVLIAGFLSTVFSIFIVSLIPLFKKILSVIKNK